MGGGVVPEVAKIIDHTRANQDPQDGEELALGEQVRLARFPDHVGDAGHRGVDLKRLGLRVLQDAEDRANRTDCDAEVHQRQTADATQAVKMNVGEVRDFDVGLARSQRGEEGSCQHSRAQFGDTTKDHSNEVGIDWGSGGCGERVITGRANFASHPVEKSRLSVVALHLCTRVAIPCIIYDSGRFTWIFIRAD